MFVFVLVSVKSEALDVSASYACVIDALSGRVLYEKNAYEKHSMASTTKIMTALVAIENKPLTDVVTVSSRAAGTEGSSMYLKSGEKIVLLDLLYGLMLASGNDAAIAIAEHVGGSVENFADMMTKKAKEIGAVNTSFKNPNGLDEEGHFTTAYDLALITKKALENETFAEIVSTVTKTISSGEENNKRTFTNHNKLLNMYEGAIGVKTGYTKKTGRCLVSAAERDGFRVIAVTLNAPDDWNDHKKMLDKAFNTYKSKPLVIKDMIIKTLPVVCGFQESIELVAEDSFYITLVSEDILRDIELYYNTPSQINAPISKGTNLGTLDISYEGKYLGSVNLVAGADVEYYEPPKPTFAENFIKILKTLLNDGVK